MARDISSYVEGWRQKILRERRANGERRQQALADAQKIARFLAENHGVKQVLGIGSAFQENRFGPHSDIDLVAEGLPQAGYFALLAEISLLTKFKVDLIPFESATALLKPRVAEEGVQLWP